MQIAIEKENLCFDQNLKPVHKTAAQMKPGIELDYADHQIEFISKPYSTAKAVIDEVEGFMADEEFENQYFWPLSMPKTNQEDFTIIGTRTNTEREYRKLLLKRYGIEKMLVSGIHINYSDYIENEKKTQDEHYFDLLKAIYTFGPLLSQFVSFTPFGAGLFENYGHENLISLRNSDEFGYGNEHLLDLDYSSFSAYNKSVEKMIATKRIDSMKELYAKVRHKHTHVELRFVDINPYERAGISSDMLDFFAAVIKIIQDIKLVDFDNKLNIENFNQVAINGLDQSLILKINGVNKTLKAHTQELFELLLNSQHVDARQRAIIERIKFDYENNSLPMHKMLNEYRENNYTNNEFGLRHLKHQKEHEILMPELKMEMSSKILIKEAQKHGVEVEIIDETANFIMLKANNQEQLVVQATKTNCDKYANILAMENKYVTKYLLDKANIGVPKGIKITSPSQVKYDMFDVKMVVKPLDTNFGMGITILEENPGNEQIDKAVAFAFSCSDVVIIEEFAYGTEYRFLVIGGETVSIVKRVPANVIGDGMHTIKELICFKNSNTIRQKGYITPLERLQHGEFEQNYLKRQGLSMDSVIKKNKQVFLRENSNVSTGGDSFEVFDDIPEYFKNEAVKAARALDVSICGVDMIIDDLNQNNYKIIEANFNPAIQMHTYPFSGNKKNVAVKILELLELL